MAALYIANTSKQNQQFFYRLPGRPRAYALEIPAGEQRTIPHEDLNTEDVNAILRDGAQYGLMDEKLIVNMRAHTGLVYSIGKPADMRRVRLAIEKNDELLQQRTETMHIDSLNAANVAMKNATGGAGAMQTLEVDEAVKPGEDRKGRSHKAAVAGSRESQQG